MTEITPGSNPYFMGKDKFVMFMGQVENVNDPKRSGRVQVRCVGWHPKEKEGEDGLKTEDLPWAKVGMPTTHAQQSRIGGKHGLLPGSWVWGYFMDGEEAQDPFVVQTFNFTAKASDQDFRQDPQGKKGKLEESDKAFDKVEVGGEQQPNIATRTPSEEGQKGYSNPEDPSGDVTADESVDECSGEASRKSVAAVRRMEQELKKADQGNAEAQTYEISIGDGLCGTVAHARDDIAKKMKEQFPSEMSRFIYGDAVWNRYTGQFMNLNGIFAQLALEMSSTMKMPMQSMKAVTEEINRITKGTTMLVPDRDGVITQALDLTTTTVADIMHGIFGSQTIDMLFQTMMGMMKSMNNSGGSGGAGGSASEDEDDSGRPTYSNPTTQISNNEALCLTDTILENVSVLTSKALDDALVSAQAAYDEDPEGSEGGGAGAGSGSVNSMLSGLSSIMQFPLTQKYSIFATIFNKAGPMSQDILTKNRGCANEREYNTGLGTMASKMGFGGQGGSGGGGSSSDTGSSGGGSRQNNASPGNNDPRTIGFGGLPSTSDPAGVQYDPCAAAKAISTPDPIYDRTSGVLPPGFGDPNNDDPFSGGNPSGPNFGGVPDGNVPVVGEDGTVNILPIQDTNAPGGAITIPVNPNDPEVNQPGSEAGLNTNTETVVYASAIDEQGQVITPRGLGAIAIPVSIPASTVVAADNFSNGIPNNVVVLDSGRRYFYNNQLTPKRAFPSIYIPGYNGVPTPVVERLTGELVAIVTEAGAWDFQKPNPKITIIPDDSPTGIVSDDPGYDIRLAGFFIENTGFNYTNPSIEIIDRDNAENKAKAAIVTSDNRIVEVIISNAGSRFMRLPEIVLTDETGFGAKLRPIMTVTVQAPAADGAIVPTTEVVYCPSKNQQNLTS